MNASLSIILRKRAIERAFVLKSETTDMLVSGISSSSDITVTTVKGDEIVQRTYPAGTTDIVTESDPNTDIRISGKGIKITN